jgi:hypothetical protein
MQRMKKTKRVKRTRKIHSKRRTQYGGNYKYDIDMSTNNELMFITMKTAPKIIYKIDLPNQIFSKYRLESDEHPLKHKQDRTLFEILYKERLNNPEVRNILSHHKINNLLLREVVFPSPRRIKRPTSSDIKNIKLGRFDKELSPIAEEDYISPQPSPSPVLPAISVLPLSSPLPLTPKKPDSAKKSTSKNSTYMQRRLVAAMNFSNSRKSKIPTPLPVYKIMQGSPYINLRNRKNNT